jgi:hypothetical protein
MLYKIFEFVSSRLEICKKARFGNAHVAVVFAFKFGLGFICQVFFYPYFCERLH